MQHDKLIYIRRWKWGEGKVDIEQRDRCTIWNLHAVIPVMIIRNVVGYDCRNIVGGVSVSNILFCYIMISNFDYFGKVRDERLYNTS